VPGYRPTTTVAPVSSERITASNAPTVSSIRSGAIGNGAFPSSA
jgi:hypothetical protein